MSMDGMDGMGGLGARRGGLRSLGWSYDAHAIPMRRAAWLATPLERTGEPIDHN